MELMKENNTKYCDCADDAQCKYLIKLSSIKSNYIRKQEVVTLSSELSTTFRHKCLFNVVDFFPAAEEEEEEEEEASAA